MSKIAVNEITDEVGTGAPTLPNGLGVTGDIDVSGKLTNGGATGVEIDQSGRFLVPSQPSFRALKTSIQTASNNSETVSWDTTVVNVGNNWDVGTFTAPIGGLYFFSIYWLSENDTNQYDINIFVNGSSNNGARTRNAEVNGHETTSSAILLKLSANDNVSAVLDQSGDKIYGEPSQTWSSFQGCFLG